MNTTQHGFLITTETESKWGVKTLYWCGPGWSESRRQANVYADRKKAEKALARQIINRLSEKPAIVELA